MSYLFYVKEPKQQFMSCLPTYQRTTNTTKVRNPSHTQ
jgi:hypothetical protein